MTATINTTFDVITITSAAIASPWGLVGGVVLTHNLDCGDDVSYTVVEGSINGSGVFTLTPADLEQTTTFGTGVYYFKLTITNVDDSVRVEKYCIFFDTTEKACDVEKIVARDEDRELALDWYILTDIACPCSCTDKCTLWNRVQAKLETC